MNLRTLAFLPLALACSNNVDVDSQAASIKYVGDLKNVFCDVKRPLSSCPPAPEKCDSDVGTLHDADFENVLGGFEKLGCNGVRVYIDPERPNAVYHTHYLDFLDAARRKGFRVYANPLGTGNFQMSDDEYVGWIVNYAKAIQPHFLGPFNESWMDNGRIARIAKRVRESFPNWRPVIVGPDSMHIEQTLGEATPSILAELDVLSSHNAAHDEGATRSAWEKFSRESHGRPTWASENPRPWHAVNASNEEVGVNAAIKGGVDGLVIYEAFPACVKADGTLTEKGKTIAQEIRP
jgi:hypothetical protein